MLFPLALIEGWYNTPIAFLPRKVWKTLFELQGRTIEVVNVAENDKEELLHDLASIVYSFCARLYRQRRAKRKTERLVEQLQAKDDGHAVS